MSKKEKKNNKLGRREKVFLFIGCIILLLLILVMYFAFFKKSNLTAIDIGKKMKDEIASIESYKKVDLEKNLRKSA